MPLSTIAKLGAGSKVYYTTGGETPVWVLLDNALTLGQVGTQGEFVETTPISKVVREYIAGMETPPQKQMSFNHLPGNADYAAYLALVDAKNPISHRFDYTTGDRATVTLVPSGRVMEEPEGNSQLKMTCFFQQSGAPQWGTIS